MLLDQAECITIYMLHMRNEESAKEHVHHLVDDGPLKVFVIQIGHLTQVDAELRLFVFPGRVARHRRLLVIRDRPAIPLK